MKKFKYTYKNCGQRRLGYDIDNLEVLLERDNFNGKLTIKMSTTKIEIKDTMYNINDFVFVQDNYIFTIID